MKNTHMTKKDFIRRIIISSVLTAMAIAIIITLCAFLFVKYTEPNEENTTLLNGTVSEVYNGGRRMGVVVEFSSGDQLQLIYPDFSGELYAAIGYDLDELCELLEGEEIEYRRMDRLPYVTEIYIDDIAINNNELTNRQIIVSRIAIVIIGLIMLAFSICGDVTYLKQQYRYYKKSEKKRVRKARRSSKATP